MGLSDEAIYALFAELQNDTQLKSLNLRGNMISNDGCKAIASRLSEMKQMIRYIDLRENRIGRMGIKLIVEALERAKIVTKVHFYKDGRIEAYGTVENKTDTASVIERTSRSKEDSQGKICLVDIRNNDCNGDSISTQDDFIGLSVVCY